MSNNLVDNTSCVSAQRGRPRIKKTEWTISLLLLGYPLLGTLVAFTSLSSLVASVPVRVLVLMLSISLILRTPRAVWASTGTWLIFLFWAIYLVRLMWDWWFVGIPVASEFMLNLIVFSIPTAIAFMQAPVIDERKLSVQLLTLGMVTCLLAIIAYYTDLAAGRSTTEMAEGRLFLETVNPITFGHVGVTTLLGALSMTRYCTRKIEWLLLGSVAILGCVVIQLSGSRGPLLSLVVCIVAAVFFRKQYRWVLLPLLMFASLFMLGNLSIESESLLVSRVNSSVSTDNQEIRVQMMAGALQQFYDSPWVGSAIIEQQFDDYPHNMFIEAAMAVGLAGLLLLIFISLRAVRRVFRALRQGNLLVPLLALQMLTAAQVSGSISQSASMWMFLALFAGAAVRQRRHVQPSGLVTHAHHQLNIK